MRSSAHALCSRLVLCALTLTSLHACTGPAAEVTQSPGAVDNFPNAGDTNVAADTNTALTPSTDSNVAQGNTVVPKPVVPTPQTPNVVVPATPGAAVRYVGRVDTRDPRGALLSWPATQIVIGFEGTRLSVTLREVDDNRYAGRPVSNAFGVSIDGGKPTTITLAQGTATYPVAVNLPRGQHTVVLTKRTEGQIGRVQHMGSTTDGTLNFTPALSNRRLEFIGDSGTAGYGTDGTYPCAFTSETENAQLAYPTLVGQMLGAEVHSIAFSGKGLVQNRDIVEDTEKMLPVLWQRTLPQDANLLNWNPSTWVPQAVFMVIGGNDFYAQTIPQSQYVPKVNAFITTLQTAYPGVHIFLGLSPMLRNDSSDPGGKNRTPVERDVGLTYARAIVAAAASDRVHFIDMPADVGDNGYGCDMHMSPATNRVEAAAVAAVLRATLGW